MSPYSVDDEFGNQITKGLETFGVALQTARRYLSAHTDAPGVLVYDDNESWELTRTDILG